MRMSEKKGRVSIMGDTVMLAIYFPLVMVGMVLVIMWGMSARGRVATDTAKTRASDFIPVKCDEHRESRWCVVEKGRRVLAFVND